MEVAERGRAVGKDATPMSSPKRTRATSVSPSTRQPRHKLRMAETGYNCSSMDPLDFRDDKNPNKRVKLR